MSCFRAACAAVLCCLCAVFPARAANPLSLNDAFQRVIESHPDLAAYRLRDEGAAAAADAAALPPPFTLGTSVENVLGSGDAVALRGAELTLSLASVIERGDKRGARVALAEREREELALLREGRRLDLLAEVARRYLDVLAARELASLLGEDLAQRERLLEAARSRVAAGADTESVALAADAAKQRVHAEQARAERAAGHARQRLAQLWGGRGDAVALAALNLDVVPALPDHDELIRRLAETPALMRFAHAERLREARLQLARSAGIADIDWQVGVRRLQADGDWGLVGSVAIPFGSAQRAEPGVRAAEAELALIALEREGQQRALVATLGEAWSQLDLAIGHVQQIDARLLPALRKAAESAARSYRAGAASYLEWAQLQGELIAVQRERLDAALTAHRALIELQRLTGQTFTVAAAHHQGATP